MMLPNKKVVMSIPLLLAVVSASAIASIAITGKMPLAYAASSVDNSNKDNIHKQDKVKVDCNDLVVVLAALHFSADRLSQNDRASVDATLEEAGIAPDLQSILDNNFQDLIQKAKQNCNDKQLQEILDLID
jgi:hypothetical protein